MTGHGVPSSLITGVAFGAIFSIQRMFEKMRGTSTDTTIDEFIINMAQIVNEAILKAGGKSQRFMTMLFLCLDLKTGEVIYVNAGHNPIYLVQHIDKSVKIIPNPGNRLGYIDKLDVKIRKFRISPNDCVFLYTDGLIENTGPDTEKDIITSKNLKKLLEQDLNLLQMKERLIKEMQRVWKDQPLADDVTFMIFKWLGNTEP